VPRWPFELVGLAALAALVATVPPRVWLTRHAPRAHAILAGLPLVPVSGAPPALVQDEIVFEDDDPPPVAPVPAASAPSAVDAGVTPVDAGRRDRRSPARASLPEGALRRRGALWIVDLRYLGTTQAAVAGMRLLPPAADAGRGHGYTIRALDRRGLLETLGVRRDDQLVAVNGIALDSPDEAIEALASARRSPEISFRLRRAGGGIYVVRVEVLGRELIGQGRQPALVTPGAAADAPRP
jgi:hypothetical protein